MHYKNCTWKKKKEDAVLAFLETFWQSILDQFWNLFKTLMMGNKNTDKMEMGITVPLIW